jgi:hypothetical protein
MGLHKLEPDIYIEFSLALNLQCGLCLKVQKQTLISSLIELVPHAGCVGGTSGEDPGPGHQTCHVYLLLHHC